MVQSSTISLHYKILVYILTLFVSVKHYAPTKWDSPCLDEVADLSGSNAVSACDGIEVTHWQTHLQS